MTLRKTRPLSRKLILLLILCLAIIPTLSNAKVAESPIPGHKDEPNQPLSAQEPFSVIVLRLGGYITEKPGVNLFSLSQIETQSLSQITDTLNQAAEDEEIGAVLLSFEQPMMSWAQVDELRRLINRLRQAGKKTYAYVESLTQLDYLLACQCDEIIMTPTGHLFLNGLAGRAVYFKDLFDKIGIDADFIQMGRFKSASESLTKNSPSNAEIQQLNQIFDYLYDHLIESIAISRSISTEKVAKIIDQGLFTAEQAQNRALIDRVMYRKDFIQLLAKQANADINLLKNYNQSSQMALNLDNPFAMITVLQEMLSGPPEPAGDAIAVVYVDGPIMLGQSGDGLEGSIVGSRTIRLALAKASADDDVKAVVVRIDSPGGSATASDIIYQAILECAAVKPVIASMASVAASGGYYVACGAPTILAEPSTITGSVGVVGGKIVIGQMLKKLGITSYLFQRGRNADLFSSFRVFTPLERQKLEDFMQQTYEIFKNCVTDSRGARLKDSIENLAQGKIYTGNMAQQLGLIDQIGGLDDAIQLAAQKADIKKYHLRILPKQKNLIELLEDLMAQSKNINDNPAALLPDFHNIKLKNLLSRTVSLLKILQHEQTLLIMPYEIILY